MNTPYVAMTTPDLVAERGRLTRAYLDAEHDGADGLPFVKRLLGVESVLSARELARTLTSAQQTARWVEVLAEHDPKRAADFAARAERAAETALSLAAGLRAGCTAQMSDGACAVRTGDHLAVNLPGREGTA
ncbi:hypothetical protein [Streptomyces boncukensis]|uniref:Uncharacterized protein n=1 Tax=Streptomyces boncukensis TaxID=2711219 RepID=A0A6G4WQ54_9ACTN|nr:hypothetical protein [Streptomyces boncukensis]NGO67143.1 hypothetical protein [Streptomyces boncukensis]